MPTWYYRYVSNPAEVKQIIDERKIQSLNPHTNHLTWYTLARYVDLNQAQRELAMPYPPTHRVGPIDQSQLGSLHVPLRLCPPLHGFSGGGLEAATYDVIWLLGLWNFHPGSWDL
jgi:hypothetical protein